MLKGEISTQPKSLREKCPNAELFLVCIFLYSVREHGPELTAYLDTFNVVSALLTARSILLTSSKVRNPFINLQMQIHITCWYILPPHSSQHMESQDRSQKKTQVISKNSTRVWRTLMVVAKMVGRFQRG